MQAGKLTSLILVVVMTALAVAVWRFSPLPAATEAASPAQLALIAGATAILFTLFLFPFGLAFDHSVASLRRYIEGAVASDRQFLFGQGSKWMRPVARAITGAVDQFRQRELALRSQLGDLEIRHRVSEAERRQTEAVLHALRDAVVVTDAFNEIVMANQAAATILGFDLKTAIHRPIDDVIADPRMRQLMRDARETANFKDCRHVEQSIGGDRGSNGQPTQARMFDVTLACVENHKHEVAGVVTILHDLTREREISEMKSDFVSKASHELRTPLSSIRAFVEMLVDGEASDEQGRQEFYKIIQGETDRLGRLIDNMLNISRIEAGIVQIERANVDFKDLAKRAIDTLEPQAKEKNISLHMRMSAVDLCVEGDQDMLFQVVLNLVSNSVKYTPDGGRVTIGGDSDNLTRSVLVTVSDTGLGIPPDAVPKLFDKFFRVENYKRVAKGTGLGLSLCKHIVETVHHGQIGVESKLGMGSKFWFNVPMQYAGSRAAA